MGKTIYGKLKDCTVRIVTKSLDNKYSVKGTGFFIGKNKILTCYHVISSDKLKVIWNDEEYDFKILEEKKDLDLILLEANTYNENYVNIDIKVNIRDNCYAFGFPNNDEENKELAKELQSDKDGMTFEVVDINDGVIKFKGEQFKEGFSGSPVLNEKTGKVCGIISISRDSDELKGGYGISIEKLSLFSYKEQNKNEITETISLKNGDSFDIKLVKVELDDNRTIYVGKYPVTFEEYDLFCDSVEDEWGRLNLPIINVDWNSANLYCKWLSDNSKENIIFKLPTAEEWMEIAKQNFPKEGFPNYKIIHKTKEVKNMEKGSLGIYGMYGNIHEWCYSPKNKEPKIVKGGSFRNSLKYIFDVTKNSKYFSEDKNEEVSFRVISKRLYNKNIGDK